MLCDPVAEYLRGHREEHLAKYFELLRIPSIANVHDTPDSCQLAAEWLAGHFESFGFEAEILPAEGKPNLLAALHVSDDAPTLLLYGHYDVQPADPLELWTTAPFAPAIRNGCVYARGASDNKGSSFAYVMALEAWQRAGGGLPVNVKFFYEGEEEIGSPHIEPFLASHAEKLTADVCVVSDSGFFSAGVPAIVYALRGLAYFQVDIQAHDTDAHSGTCGGLLANPLNALAAMLAAMHDETGRITLEGLYDDLPELTDAERRAWAELPFNEDDLARQLGVPALTGGETGLPALERRWARPTLDCNGIVGGYTDPGAKTIIPAAASMKVSLRLPPPLDPDKVAASFTKFVAAHTPATMTSSVQVLSRARPVMLKPPPAALAAMRTALAEAFGREPAMIRMGATIPIVEVIQRLLGLDAVVAGLSLPDDGTHGPNERFRLDHLYNGSRAAAAFIQNFAAGASAGGKGGA